MDDLIRRSEALNALGDCPYNWCDEIEEIQAVADWRTHVDAIKKIPAVDAVEVVRCRDCKHYSPLHGNRGRCNARSTLGLNGMFYSHNVWTDENKFCSDGERRESE